MNVNGVLQIFPSGVLWKRLEQSLRLFFDWRVHGYSLGKAGQKRNIRSNIQAVSRVATVTRDLESAPATPLQDQQRTPLQTTRISCANIQPMQRAHFIVEQHPDGFIAYPLGVRGVVIGQGDTGAAALEDARSALSFHIETFGEASSQST
jgi:hypothetical protein